MSCYDDRHMWQAIHHKNKSQQLEKENEELKREIQKLREELEKIKTQKSNYDVSR